MSSLTCRLSWSFSAFSALAIRATVNHKCLTLHQCQAALVSVFSFSDLLDPILLRHAIGTVLSIGTWMTYHCGMAENYHCGMAENYHCGMAENYHCGMALQGGRFHGISFIWINQEAGKAQNQVIAYSITSVRYMPIIRANVDQNTGNLVSTASLFLQFCRRSGHLGSFVFRSSR